MPVLLDTTVVIDVLRGRPAAGRLRALATSPEVPYICAVTAAEVQRGIHPGEQGRAAAVLQSFRVAPLGILEGILAGEWERDFRSRGVTLGASDCLIAAAALGVRATIATGNPRHFPMDGITVEHWPVGA